MITTLSPLGRVTSNPELYAQRWNAFALRVRQFTGSLSPARRAEVARRSRFRNQPYLRRTDNPNLDDFQP